MEQQGSQEAAAGDKPLPADFAARIATKIVVTNERERDPDKAVQKVADLIMRNLAIPGRERYFIDAMASLLEGEESRRYAAISWISVSLDRQGEKIYEDFIEQLLDVYIADHTNIAKPEVELDRRRKFSFFAVQLGDTFITMMDINSELYEGISLIFSILIRKEMTLDRARGREDKSLASRFRSAQKDKSAKAAKKLYDEIVDYIHARGDFKSDSLNQQNPNEFMAILADRMRSTRRYVIQDIMNRQALNKKKETEKELSERLASAEEIILGRASFKNALNLFWTEKRYNFKYISVEKVRVTIQVLAVIVGIVHFLAGYLEIGGMVWWEGVGVAAGMYLFARFLASRNAFKRYFPDDVSKELEVVVGSITPTLRKMSKEQMEAFLIQQVRDPDNLSVLFILPEFLKYVYAVMPERASSIVGMEELTELVDTMELDIARTIRANQEAPPPI